MANAPLEFWFEFASTYSYPAAHAVEADEPWIDDFTIGRDEFAGGNRGTTGAAHSRYCHQKFFEVWSGAHFPP